jgi:D-alanine-D-alanine ligase
MAVSSKKTVSKTKAPVKKAAPAAKKTAKKASAPAPANKNRVEKTGAASCGCCSSHDNHSVCGEEKINLGVFFGGRSSEHEVSLVSAKNIIEAIDKDKYNVIPVGITKNGNMVYLKNSLDPVEIIKNGVHAIFIAQPDVSHNLWIIDDNNKGGIEVINIEIAFPVLHGPFGEDGKVQALFEMAAIPYIGSEVLGSAAAMDKTIMKSLFMSYDLPIVNFVHFTVYDYKHNKKEVVNAIKSSLQLPYFVKPANLGSSVGITKVTKITGLEAAIKTAGQYDNKIIVEQGHDVREIEVAVMGNFELEAAEPGEVIPAAEFYDYNDKYKAGKAKFCIPAKLPKEQLEDIKELALAAYRAVDAKGFARVDMFVDKKTQEIYVNEINTIPGFTSISMFPKMFEASGMSYGQIVEKLIGYAIELFEAKCALKV